MNMFAKVRDECIRSSNHQRCNRMLERLFHRSSQDLEKAFSSSKLPILRAAIRDRAVMPVPCGTGRMKGAIGHNILTIQRCFKSPHFVERDRRCELWVY